MGIGKIFMKCFIIIVVEISYTISFWTSCKGFPRFQLSSFMPILFRFSRICLILLLSSAKQLIFQLNSVLETSPFVKIKRSRLKLDARLSILLRNVNKPRCIKFVRVFFTWGTSMEKKTAQRQRFLWHCTSKKIYWSLTFFYF